MAAIASAVDMNVKARMRNQIEARLARIDWGSVSGFGTPETNSEAWATRGKCASIACQAC
eukprot:2164582-Pleurochrysis_carterae.AAC.2